MILPIWMKMAVLMEYLRRMWFMMVFSNRTGAIPMIQMPECLE